jgi:multidrug efflux pump subunit AcrA (membrane-fusion protein)
VRPGDKLFRLRLVSEYVQASQSELFKTAGELKIVRNQLQRLSGLDRSGGIPESKVLDLQNQEKRLAAALQAVRHALLARGFTPAEVDQAQGGQFLTGVEVVAPPALPGHRPLVTAPAGKGAPKPGATAALRYEVQELKAELGQQVQAGQVLAFLSNHQSLLVEGRAFKREVPLVETAARNGWPVEIEVAPPDAAGWPALQQTFVIHSIGNVVDPASRTVPFYLPLVNQSRAYERGGATFLTWRFRPGQRLRLHVRVQLLKDAIVVPTDAVIREGVETYVFRQNGELFDRKPVRVLHEDRRHVVLANDGSVAPGLYVAQNGATALNRALKAQNLSGAPAGGHFHADGTFHAH